MTYLVYSSWPPEQCQKWVPSHGVGLESNQVLGCLEVPVDPFSQQLLPTHSWYWKHHLVTSEATWRGHQHPLVWFGRSDLLVFRRPWN